MLQSRKLQIKVVQDASSGQAAGGPALAQCSPPMLLAPAMLVRDSRARLVERHLPVECRKRDKKTPAVKPGSSVRPANRPPRATQGGMKKAQQQTILQVYLIRAPSVLTDRTRVKRTIGLARLCVSAGRTWTAKPRRVPTLPGLPS
jgi:hypothetical protein